MQGEMSINTCLTNQLVLTRSSEQRSFHERPALAGKLTEVRIAGINPLTLDDDYARNNNVVLMIMTGLFIEKIYARLYGLS